MAFRRINWEKIHEMKKKTGWSYSVLLGKSSNYCLDCKAPISSTSKRCHNCARKEFVNRPEQIERRNNPEYRERQMFISAVNQLERPKYHREPYGIEFTEFLKNQIRKRDNFICQYLNCYIPENGKRHSVHHIDYNKKNNKPENLILLCGSHHALTCNSNKEYWIEYFQSIQEMRNIKRVRDKSEIFMEKLWNGLKKPFFDMLVKMEAINEKGLIDNKPAKRDWVN